MKISNRVKRNIAFTLLLTGCACIIARGWQVAICPSSFRTWFELFNIMFLTSLCLGRFIELRRRVNRGITFGRR